MQRRDAVLRAMKDGARERHRSERPGDGDLSAPGLRPDRCRSEDGAAEQAARSSHCGAIGSSPMARPEICEEMHKIAEKRRRFGYRRVGILLERKGMIMNEIGAREANDPGDRL